MYMDDIKLFAKSEKELETLIKAVMIYSDNIGMEFGVEKSAMVITKSGKWQMTEEIKLPNGEKETYKYFEILEVGTINHSKIKETK